MDTLPIGPVHNLLHQERVIVEPAWKDSANEIAAGAQGFHRAPDPWAGKTDRYLDHLDFFGEDFIFQASK